MKTHHISQADPRQASAAGLKATAAGKFFGGLNHGVTGVAHPVADEARQRKILWFQMRQHTWMKSVVAACGLCLLFTPGVRATTFSWSAASNRISVQGGGSATLTDIKTNLPIAPLDLVDATNKIWLLRAELLVQDGCTLKLHGGTGGDVNELRIQSVNSATPCDCVVSVTADWGTLDINSTKITSWDTMVNAPDTDYLLNGRAYIAVFSSLSTNGVTPLESRMDITNSEICYLGCTNSNQQGLVWKVAGSDPNPTNNIFNEVNVYGNVVSSKLHDNYIGAYTFGAHNMNWQTNDIYNNAQYGLNLKDYSDGLLVQGNKFRNNGNSGLAASVGCELLTIRANLATNNAASGILLDQASDDSLVESNTCLANADSGISIDDSARNTVRGNLLMGNQQAGLRLTLGSADNLVQNNQSVTNTKYGFYCYQGSGASDPGDDGHPKRNLFLGNVVHDNGADPIRLSDSDNNTFATNTFTDVSDKLRFESGLTNWLDGNSIPSTMAVHTEGDTNSQASTFVRNQPYLNVELGTNATTTVVDAQGKIYDPDEGNIPTTISTNGSTLPLTTAGIGSSTTIIARNLFAKTGAGKAFLNQLVWSPTTNVQWSVMAGALGQSLNFTVGSLATNANYAILKAGVTVTNIPTGASGQLQFSDLAASTDSVTYLVQQQNLNINTNLATFKFSAALNKIYVYGGGSATLSDIQSALPDAPLSLVDATNKIWLLSANLLVQDGCKLMLHGGTNGDVNELRLLSLNTGASNSVVSVIADWGALDINGTKVTSWDTAVNGPDTNYVAFGRAYLDARSTLSTNGITPQESRMDITNSEICFLGANASETYGVVWKVAGSDPNPTNNIFNEVNVYGNVVNSRLHDNYIGAYTFGAHNMNWLANDVYANAQYGLQFKDYSDNFLIQGNKFRNNGNHGFVASVGCVQLTIRANLATNNAASGILLDQASDDSLVESNTCLANADSGISIDDSARNTVRNNLLMGNQQAGLRLTLGSADNVVQNNESASNTLYGFYGYIGSGTPDPGDDGRPKRNLLVGNLIHDNGTEPIRLSDCDNNTVATNRFTDVSGKLRFQRGFTNWLDGDIIPATMSARTEGVVGTNALTYVRNEPSLNVELGTNAATIVVDAQGRIYQPDETALPTVVTTNGSTLILDQAGIGSSTTITARELWAGAAPGSAIINRLVWTNSTSRQWSATAGAVGQALNFTVGGLASNSGYTVRKAGAVFTNVSSTASGQLQIADKGSDTNTAVYYLNLQSANLPPVLPVIADQTINELATLKVTNTATDTETPGSLLTYGLLSAPTNATISASGIISWKPTEAQGPSTNIIVTKVTDDGAPPLSSTNSFMVLVNEVNSAPRLPVQPNLTINAGATLTVTNTATDTDIPANGLTYQLTAAPINAVIDAGGVITWTTPTNQAPSTNLFVTVVTDNGVPPLSATNNFTVTVVAGSEPQAVALRISITPTNTLVISWPAPSTGWTLQRTGDLVTTNGWTDVNQAQVSNIGGENEVIVANLTEKAFYRLKLSQP